MLVFDIETGPRSDTYLATVFTPPDPPEHPGKFDQGTVALGNLVDPDKIQARIDLARGKHQAKIDNHPNECTRLAIEAWEEFRGTAALDAGTGEVLAIGYFNPKVPPPKIHHVGDMSETDMLEQFWIKAEKKRESGDPMVGLNIHDFDLPFLIRRSWILGVNVPDWLLYQNRFFDRIFVDLRKIWLCGQWGKGARSNFDHLGKAFGTGGKQDGIDGSMFADMFENDREAAINYLENDLKQPAKWALKMGVT